MTDETTAIRLYRKTYRLPKLDRPDLVLIQNQIQERQQIIKAGKRVRSQWMGLIKKEEKLNFEETFQELDGLIKDYDQVIGFLSQHKREYQKFFLALTEEVKTVVRDKCQELLEKENKRQTLENKNLPEDLKSHLRLEKSRITRIVILLGRTSLLMLKKIEIISEGIQKLAEDQETQRQVLGKMLGELNDYKEVYQLKMDIDRLEREVIDMAKVAVNLEQYLKPVIGQFQGLIDRVVKIDGQLSIGVSEIESLVQDILRSEAKVIPMGRNEGLSRNLLNFLVTSEEKRERLGMALEQAEREGWQWSADFPDEEIELNVAIDRINAHVIEQVSKFREPFKDIAGERSIEIVPNEPRPSSKTENRPSIPVQARKEAIQGEPQPARDFNENLGDNLTLEMVAIPWGTFLMGSPEGEGFSRERPQHPVTIQPFYMGKYPITQAQWKAVANLPKIEIDLDPDPSYFKGDNRPIESVTWLMAVEFCQRLSKHTGKEYRLPSEAEWEYACRARTTSRYAFGDILSADLANYGEIYGGTTPVGQFPANAFGLHDMHGNVWEWCEDDWHNSYGCAPSDGSAWTDNEQTSQGYECYRGGSWAVVPRDCRSASRGHATPLCIDNYIGFRVARAFLELP